MNKPSEVLEFLGKSIFFIFILFFVFYYKFKNRIKKFLKL